MNTETESIHPVGTGGGYPRRPEPGVPDCFPGRATTLNPSAPAPGWGRAPQEFPCVTIVDEVTVHEQIATQLSKLLLVISVDDVGGRNLHSAGAGAH